MMQQVCPVEQILKIGTKPMAKFFIISSKLEKKMTCYLKNVSVQVDANGCQTLPWSQSPPAQEIRNLQLKVQNSAVESMSSQG